MMRAQLWLVFCAISFNCFGQQYIPLPTSNATWKVMHNTFVGGHYHNLIIGSDTILNGNVYRIIEDDVIPGFRAIRELPSKQVEIYRNPPYIDTVVTLYDFSMNVGDSMLSPNPPFLQPEYLIVDSIGYMQMGPQTRKFWRLSYSVHTSKVDWWIEGIGSLHGIIFPGYVNVEDGKFELLCFQHEGSLIYEHVSYPYCDSLLSASSKWEDEPLSHLSVHPNPTTGVFTVKGPSLHGRVNATGTIEVFDLFGRKVLETEQQQIDLSQHSKGIYIVRAATGQGIITKKVVVQ